MEDGRELFFDHGAPYFCVSDKEVMEIVTSWEARGLVAEWQAPFGAFDCSAGKFVDLEKVCPGICLAVASVDFGNTHVY